MKLEQFSALELGTLVNIKEISPVEVINYYIDRISIRNPRIHAFTYTRFDDALREAVLLESRILKGESGGIFAGVPVGLKDFLSSKKGWTHSYGGVPHLIQVDEVDSEFYKAASSLGAIAVGKTNAPPFGFSGACQNTMYGATVNPFDSTRTPGGSSGGSAAAVADGLLLMAEGGDAGGSIRIPSSWCNLFGFKPSKGTVPSYCRPDAWAATHPYCFNGAITKTVADSAAIYTQMAYYNPKDPISLPINASKNFLELMEKPITHMKIGFTSNFDLYPVVDPEIQDIVANTAKQLQSVGVFVEPISFTWKHSLQEILHCWCWSISIDTALELQQWKQDGLDIVKDYQSELPEEFIYFNELAAAVDIQDFKQFNEIRTEILDNFEATFEDYDFIVSPTCICKPLKLSDKGHCKEVNGIPIDPATNFISFGETPLVNFIGYPAASIPAGLTRDGLPVGMHVIGKMYRDEDVFALARTVERIQPWKYNFEKLIVD